MPLDLATLLSQPLVAFTIELDNEYEHQANHSTTQQAQSEISRRGPWLTSYAMYANCLQFLSETFLSVRDLRKLARTSTNLDGMRRWGYIQLTPPPDKPKSKRPNDDWLITPTLAGLIAQQTWRPLPQLVEQRWRERFGSKAIDALRDALTQINSRLDAAYPDILPILGYGLFTLGPGPKRERIMPPLSDAPLQPDAPLTALLSRPLCAFAYGFERISPVSLTISANLLRTLDTTGIRNRDIPQLTGVSKESIAMAMGILQKAALVEIGAGAAKTIRLTPAGLAAQQHALQRIAHVEDRWIEHFGKPAIQQLRGALEFLVGDPQAVSSPLLQGLKPYPENWRASTPLPQTLPHFPMILHRGGYPDGS